MQVRKVRLQIETARHKIQGNLQLPTEGYRSRTTDFLNSHESGFIALTDVELQPLDGGEPEQHGYAAVGARHIITLMEIQELGTGEEEAPPTAPLAEQSVPPPSV
jgi:hypothetical protein